MAMERTLSKAEVAVAAVRLVRSDHHLGRMIRVYECTEEHVDPDLAFRALMGVALASAYERST
jgi:hypothetical protein